MGRFGKIVGAIAASVLAVGLLTTLALGVTGRLSGGAITAVRVADVPSADFTAGTFADIPGASTAITVPASSQAIVLARFSSFAEVGSNSNVSNDVDVRIMIGPPGGPFTVMQPGETVFVHAPANQTVEATGVTDQSYGPIGPGTYVVKVQALVTTPAAVQFGAASLTVEEAKA